MNTETTPTPVCQPVSRGFAGLPCPRCGANESAIAIDLTDLTGDEAIHCHECEADFGLDEVREFLAKWSKVVAWIDLAPELE